MAAKKKQHSKKPSTTPPSAIGVVPLLTLRGLPTVDSRPEAKRLLEALKQALPTLLKVQAECDGEDSIYRFYHQSYKVYYIQESTKRIAEALAALMPERKLNTWFTQIIAKGTGRKFSAKDNKRWPRATRPMVEAFFHAKYFLDMAIRYGFELTEPPAFMPSGWAAVLYLFNLR